MIPGAYCDKAVVLTDEGLCESERLLKQHIVRFSSKG
jgi:hypothetical protein